MTLLEPDTLKDRHAERQTYGQEDRLADGRTHTGRVRTESAEFALRSTRRERRVRTQIDKKRVQCKTDGLKDQDGLTDGRAEQGAGNGGALSLFTLG